MYMCTVSVSDRVTVRGEVVAIVVILWPRCSLVRQELDLVASCQLGCTVRSRPQQRPGTHVTILLPLSISSVAIQ